MSLLDTFALLFETDAGEAADDVDRLSDSLDDAGGAGNTAAKGVDNSATAANKGAESFSGMAKSVGGLIAAYLSWQAVSTAVIGQALATDELGKFTETLGLSITEIDAWGAAAERNGGSAAAFRGSIETLNGALADISLGGGGDIAEVFGRLGVSALDAEGRIRPVMDLLPDLADSFQNLSKRESVAFGQKLGLDQGTILMLQKGRDAVEQMVEQQRQLGGRTQEGYEASAKFNDTLADTGRIFTGLSDLSNQTILPLLSKMLEGFQKVVAWVVENKTIVSGFFIGVAGVLTAIYLPAIIAAAGATLVAVAPFIAIGAAVAAVGVAFALLYEDVVAYLGGQESFIGSLAEKYAWFGDALKLFGDVASGVADGVAVAFEAMGAVIMGVINFLINPINSLRNIMDGIGSAVSGFFGGEIDVNAMVQQSDNAIAATAAANANPLLSGAGAAGNRNTFINQTNQYSASVDARGMSREDAAAAFSEQRQKEIAQAKGMLDDGVAY